MPEPLKNMINYDMLLGVASAVRTVYSPFEVDAFIAAVMDETWDGLELLARSRKITVTIAKFLPQDYATAVDILEKALQGNPTAFFFPDFIEVFGQDEENWDISVAALGRNTCFWSSELAVRPFIVKDESRMMAQMYEWSLSDDEHLRRLSSEGCRPALPWAMALSKFKKDPSPVLPILTRLRADPSLYVRRSVANNLNDISKTHPELVVALAQEWYGENEDTNWIIKHALRSLLKKGNRDALALFGYSGDAAVTAADFSLDKNSVKIGGDISFSFVLTAAAETKVRLEFGIDYVKANGKQSRKIFQISEMTMRENETKTYVKKHSFADLSTRKHYPGGHAITLIVNGTPCGTVDFEVTV